MLAQKYYKTIFQANTGEPATPPYLWWSEKLKWLTNQPGLHDAAMQADLHLNPSLQAFKQVVISDRFVQLTSAGSCSAVNYKIVNICSHIHVHTILANSYYAVF